MADWRLGINKHRSVSRCKLAKNTNRRNWRNESQIILRFSSLRFAGYDTMLIVIFLLIFELEVFYSCFSRFSC
jgi:hypothetical protein